jgi:uncharacterized protein
MSEASPFDLGFDELPTRLPIFPLTGALLLPRGRLPLRIFEPRYIAMTLAALAAERLIGMVQPVDGAGDAGEPAIYRIGCAGRIVSFAESEDGRGHFLVALAGTIRFDVAEELELGQPYRTVRPDWRRFRNDLAADDGGVDRARLMELLKPFFERHKINADFGAIESAAPERLVNTLAMVCPFQPREKQALLEAADTMGRAELLIGLLEMALHASVGTGPARH